MTADELHALAAKDLAKHRPDGDWPVAEAAALRRAWQAGTLVRRDLPPKPFDGTYPIEGERRARIRESTGQGGGT